MNGLINGFTEYSHLGKGTELSTYWPTSVIINFIIWRYFTLDEDGKAGYAVGVYVFRVLWIQLCSFVRPPLAMFTQD